MAAVSIGTPGSTAVCYDYEDSAEGQVTEEQVT